MYLNNSIPDPYSSKLRIYNTHHNMRTPIIRVVNVI